MDEAIQEYGDIYKVHTRSNYEQKSILLQWELSKFGKVFRYNEK